jgi:hypothetical protein
LGRLSPTTKIPFPAAAWEVRSYGDVVIVLSTVLRIRRTLDGAEIDRMILDVETRKALALERRRRAD